MRAIAIDEFGGPDKLRPMALPRPRAEKGEVLLHVVAAGVNPVDWMIREGQLKDAMPHRFPLIPGWDVAGVVEELGSGTTRFRKGDRVWACARKPVARWGTYAEYVNAAEDCMALMPTKLLFEEAASATSPCNSPSTSAHASSARVRARISRSSSVSAPT